MSFKRKNSIFKPIFIILYTFIHVCVSLEIRDLINTPDVSGLPKYDPARICAEATDWESWHKMIQWTFLNNTWVPYNIYGIRYREYNQYVDYWYWNNASDRDSVDLSSFPDKSTSSKEINQFSLTLSHGDESTVYDHSLCQWSIATGVNQDKRASGVGCKQDPGSEVTLEIIRNSANYEEIYVELATTNGWRYFDSRSIAQCGSQTLTFHNTTNVKIRSNKLNELSNVSIKVSEKYLVTCEYSSTSVFLVLTFVGLFFLIFFITWAYTFIKNYLENVQTTKEAEQKAKRKIKRAKEIMDQMKKGRYTKIKLKYREKVWAICLERYRKNQSLHLINGCKHSFHSKCLRKSFEKVKFKHSLKCPSWNTILTVTDNNITLDTNEDTELRIN